MAIAIKQYNVTPTLPDNGLTIAELFAGGGLMAVGLRAAGFNVVWANDFDKRACEAYRNNIGEHIVQGDITAIDLEDIPDVDVVAGGPPCQDYSVAGAGAGEEGERGKLVWAYLNVIERKRPKAFIFENVKGLVGKRHRATFDALLTHFERIGYVVNWRVINAWDYGVAQKRERVFIVGIRVDLGVTFQFPEPDAAEQRTQVLRDIIGDLPEPVDLVGKNVKRPEHKADLDGPAPVITTQFRCQSVDIANHDPKPLDALYYPDNHCGGVLTSEYVGHTASSVDGPAKTIVAGKQVVPGGANCFYPENHQCFDNVGNNPSWDHANREADPDQPAPTRTEKDRCDGINPINGRPRRFTVRECLRIQSVPDSYVLPDTISLSAQYRIVGNGVASRVAYLLGIALSQQLSAVSVTHAKEAA